MKTYEILVCTTHLYSTRKKFANEEEASIWADEQGGTVCLDDEADWSFDDGTFEVVGVTAEEAA